MVIIYSKNVASKSLQNQSARKIQIEVQEGVIVESVIFSDCLFPDLVTSLQRSLISAKYGPATIRPSAESGRL